jgi:hypothetical protein
VNRKKNKLPFDKRGGVLVKRRLMVESCAYSSLSPQAKVLIDLMQLHWRNDEPVAYGVREAQEKIPCGRKKAMMAFDELQSNGFIVMIDESLFNSRTCSKARTWQLTWLPYKGKPPTNDWETDLVQINATGLLSAPVIKRQVSKVTPLNRY